MPIFVINYLPKNCIIKKTELITEILLCIFDEKSSDKVSGKRSIYCISHSPHESRQDLEQLYCKQVDLIKT